jgi:alpha-beta hydrolase superfamily lysophospholipase
MRDTEGELVAGDGLRLHARRWEPDQPAKVVVCLVHGLGEHSGRYPHVAARLCDAGYAVSAIDLRGHGRSGGTRGHAPIALVHDDVALLLADAEERYDGRPRFLYGHSLGGLIVLSYVLKRRPDLAGVVASAPGLRSPVLEQRLKMSLARLLGSVAPSVVMPTGLDDSGISRDPAVVAAYRADPLVHDKASLALGRDGSVYAAWTLEHAGEFPQSVPLLLLHGTADRLVYAAGSEEFARKVPGDVTLKRYEGLYHEVHNEPEQAEVLADVVGWLDAHLPSE